METSGQFGSPEAPGRTPDFSQWLLESLPNGVVGCDADGRLTLLNQTAREWFGDDLAGISLDEWANRFERYRDGESETLPANEEPLVLAFQGNTISGVYLTMSVRGKPARHLRISGGPIKDATGGRLGAVVVMDDITNLRLADRQSSKLEETNRKLQAALDQQERENVRAGRERALLRCILDSADDLIFIKDLKGVYLGCNRASEKFLGLPESEQIGKTDYDFFSSEAADVISAVDRQVVESGKPVRADELVTYADGHKALMDTVKVPYRGPDGELLGLVGIARDITERRRAQEALKKSEAKYMDLYENAPDMYLSVNAKTTLIEECNMTLADALGHSKAEIIGRPVFDIYHPDCLEEAKETFKLFANTGSVHDKELQLQRKNGSKLDISLNVTSVRGEDGQILVSRLTLRDITERKRNSEVNAARLRLLQFAASCSLDDLLEETLNEVEKITHSLIGFYHFVDDDQRSLTLQNWSASTKANFCKAQGKGMHYPIEQAGVWVDCVHEGRPVIHNDYASLEHRKGMPQGHAAVARQLVVPVFRGDKIKAILGVGNKATDYTANEAEAVSLLADFAWEIAERKLAEEKMLRSDQRLRLHSEQSPLGFLEWDQNFHAVEWNAACERIFGYTRDEAIGRHAKDLILPANVHELVEGIYRSLMSQNGGQYSINENVTKDGRIIICEWFNTTLIDRDGKAIGVASICRDITEQKRMESELSRYREHLEEQVKERTAALEIARNKAQQYLDIAGVILVAIDKDQRVALINQKGCEVLGGTAGQIVGQDWFEAFVPAAVRPDVIQTFRKLMTGEIGPVKYFENPVLNTNGQERLVAWHNALLRDDEGNIVGTLSSGEDVTEQRHTEKQITSLNQNLLKRTVALEAVNKELEAFAYSVSHDLRAPLRHIGGFLELLRKKEDGALDEQSRHFLDTIANATEKMGRLIDNLLSFSRMGRHAMSYQQVELGALVRDIIREFTPDAADRSIEWHIGDLPVVYGDRAMLQMAFGNLIANALKFTRSRRQARIEIGSLPGGHTDAVVFVRDNGVGFDMNYVDKLFGVFQRLHHADEFEGSGIGLANVRRIIARHGGRTWAQGDPDSGATFFLSLPCEMQGRADEGRQTYHAEGK